MREVLRLVPLLGYWVDLDGPYEGGEGVVDSVHSATPGVLITFVDGCSVHLRDPDEWTIGVYRRAPGLIDMGADAQ